MQVQLPCTRSRHTCRCAAAAPAEAPAAAPAPVQEPQVELEVLPGTKRRITVTVPARLCKQAWQKTISQTRKSKDIKIDGFRDLKNVSCLPRSYHWQASRLYTFQARHTTVT